MQSLTLSTQCTAQLVNTLPGHVLLSIHTDDLKKVLQRALNTWPDAPKHLIALADTLETNDRADNLLTKWHHRSVEASVLSKAIQETFDDV